MQAQAAVAAPSALNVAESYPTSEVIWNVRSTNQGKLEVLKQEMARVNIDILGISELTWTGMGEFNSDDHYYCGQEALRRNGVVIIVNERNAVIVNNHRL